MRSRTSPWRGADSKICRNVKRPCVLETLPITMRDPNAICSLQRSSRDPRSPPMPTRSHAIQHSALRISSVALTFDAKPFSTDQNLISKRQSPIPALRAKKKLQDQTHFSPRPPRCLVASLPRCLVASLPRCLFALLPRPPAGLLGGSLHLPAILLQSCRSKKNGNSNPSSGMTLLCVAAVFGRPPRQSLESDRRR